MGLNCGCPAATALTDLAIQECAVSVGQIQKILFQRVYSAPGVLNTIAAAPVLLKATWTALLAAADSTKVLVSPYLQGPTVEPGKIKTFGGGNETLGGIEIVIGSDPTAFSAKIYNIAQNTVKQMKKLMCEEIGVWFIDENGKIIAKADDPVTPTTYYPFPIRKVFVGDLKLGGFDEPDSNAVEFSLPSNWSDNLVLVTPTDFNPLTDLAN